MSYMKMSKAFLVVSAVLVAAALVVLVTPGPRLSIEFTGGTLMELDLPEGKTRDDLAAALRTPAMEALPVESAIINRTKTDTFFLRTEGLTLEQHNALIAGLEGTMGDITELQYTTIGPSVGASLKRQAIIALLIAGIGIILYLAFAFRKMPKQLSPWTFGAAAIAAVIHDVGLLTGIFVLLSYVTTFQMDTLFIAALLSTMGYSMSDTIVIFDRIRDNLKETGGREPFDQLVARSLKQTLTRTLNTGLGAMIMLLMLFIFGSESIRWFMLAMILGTVIGTYSSFFVAPPLLILWQKRQRS